MRSLGGRRWCLLLLHLRALYLLHHWCPMWKKVKSPYQYLYTPACTWLLTVVKLNVIKGGDKNIKWLATRSTKFYQAVHEIDCFTPFTLKIFFQELKTLCHIFNGLHFSGSESRLYWIHKKQMEQWNMDRDWDSSCDWVNRGDCHLLWWHRAAS